MLDPIAWTPSGVSTMLSLCSYPPSLWTGGAPMSTTGGATVLQSCCLNAIGGVHNVVRVLPAPFLHTAGYKVPRLCQQPEVCGCHSVIPQHDRCHH